MSRSAEDRFGHLRATVREMRSVGVPFSQIGRKLGMSKTTAWRLADDDNEARYARSTLASFAKRAKERV